MTLEEALRHSISPSQDDLDEHLNAAEVAINNAWQETVQNTPCMLNSGQHTTRTPASVQVGHQVPTAKAFTSDLQEAVESGRAAWAGAQDRQAEYANQKRRDVAYKVGDTMLLSTKNIRLKILVLRNYRLSGLVHTRWLRR